jgi:hypothetical protein
MRSCHFDIIPTIRPSRGLSGSAAFSGKSTQCVQSTHSNENQKELKTTQFISTQAKWQSEANLPATSKSSSLGAQISIEIFTLV